ncbi:hypothetical protein HZS_7323 [Henneguya salminicola]|nr:hypothetical protein HZS_7323 [Henneguya salminicola]
MVFTLFFFVLTILIYIIFKRKTLIHLRNRILISNYKNSNILGILSTLSLGRIAKDIDMFFLQNARVHH